MTPEALINTARKYKYVREESPNAGHPINEWLANVGCEPGSSWCAAAAVAWIQETDPTFPIHKTAGALKFLQLNKSLEVPIQDLQPGDFIIADHGGGLGHVSLCTEAVRINGSIAGVSTIAGNTSADGISRNGDRVAEHPSTLDKVVGVIRVCSQDSI